MLKINDSHEHSFSFTQEQVNTFIEISGDNNPIHYDEEYASGTVFKKPIIHGIFTASIFSKVIGTIFPGKGSIYMQQQVEFLRPMYCEEEYTSYFKVISIDERRHTAEIETSIKNKTTGKLTVRGVAKVMNKEKI